MQLVTKSCSKCGQPHTRPQRYCRDCHAKSMRGWRKKHPLVGRGQIARARAYAGVYKRRGKLTPEPCAVCGAKAQMHHPDYSRPLLVVWLCRAHHLELHALERSARNVFVKQFSAKMQTAAAKALPGPA